jgi:hypothetical protein
MQRSRDESQQTRIDGEKREVARRLRDVCRHMPDADFEALVTQIVTINLKYITLRSDAMFKTPARSSPAEPAKG